MQAAHQNMKILAMRKYINSWYGCGQFYKKEHVTYINIRYTQGAKVNHPWVMITTDAGLFKELLIMIAKGQICFD